jgi:phage terminase small subunit
MTVPAKTKAPPKRKTPKKRKPKGTLPGPSRPSARRDAFVQEYIIDLNGAQAAIRAGYAAGSATVTAARLLADVKVKALVKTAMDERAKRTGITQDKVLRRWWDIASADATELSAIHIRCCRHCYGVDHLHQWIDPAEYEKECALAVEGEEPSDGGGYGYNPTRPPASECPKCSGQGFPHVQLADTRTLSPAARLLFDTAKETKYGIEVKIQDRAKALEHIARHLGMFNDKINLGVDPTNPLIALMTQMAGKVLKPVADDE